ncbi:MAG: DUF1934 domain-containing protein [Clostridia bacterium]|nr:DUF1934 domain-containing protein [Clostridia bacterium]
MENNVMICIKTLQESDGERLDPIELETPGKFGVINGKYYIKYEESEMTGFPDTTTTLKIWKDNVVVSRKGKFNMKIHYESGEKNLCLYPTPYGEIGAVISTSKVKYNFKEDGGNLRVDYVLDADNENFINNSLRVSVRKTERK